MIQSERELLEKYLGEYGVTPKTGVDLGCGPLHQSDPKNADKQWWRGRLTEVDKWPGAEPEIVADIRNLHMFQDEQFEFVVASHILEDLVDPREGLEECWRILKPGGVLFTLTPHGDHYPHVGHPDANPAHTRDYWPEDMLSIISSMGWRYELLSFDSLHNRWSFDIIIKKVK
ncbi:MAG: methyltransferase domain-containing protein [Deltaproteobacteria bacterium]|nr:MAG: methyltransferase domain-containing protein [Deltaproteobacteria bacterium]